MIELLKAPDIELLRSIIQNPELAKVHTGLKDVDPTQIQLAPNTYYIVGIDTETSKPVGMITLKPFTNLTYEVHPYILPEYWKNRKARFGRELGYEVYNFLKQDTQIKKLFTYIPASRQIVINYAKKFGFKEISRMKDALVYFDELTDLVLLELDIKRD